MTPPLPTQTALPVPDPGRRSAEAFVSTHLSHLVCDEVAGSGSFAGGQRAAVSAKLLDLGDHAGVDRQRAAPVAYQLYSRWGGSVQRATGGAHQQQEAEHCVM